MAEVVDEQVRNVLQAMRQMLGFASAVLARLDTDRGGLVLSFALGERLPFLRVTSESLGFDPTGAAFPLWAEDSLFVRCYRQGRLISTTDLADLWRGALSDDSLEPLASAVGPRLYVCVPVPGGSGAILAVVLLERSDTAPLTSDERDRLLLYAARLGQFLEADRLGTPPVDSGSDSPVSRWLSVHLFDRSKKPVWSAGMGPDARAVMAALSADLKPGQHEVTLADGRVVLVNVYAVHPGGPVSWLLLCENLAQRDREVRELREQLRLRLARVQEAVVTFDREGRVTGCNDAARDVLGFEPAEMIGLSFEAFLPEGGMTPSHLKFGELLAEQGHAETHFRLQRRDGTRFPAEVSVLLLSEAGEGQSGIIATVRDLSEQKRQAAERGRLQSKLLRSERLAALGEMAARIAHEVRNPLAGIGAAALSIEEDEQGGERARAQAGAIGAEVRRLDAILTELLDFARPRKVAPKIAELDRLVTAVVEVARADPMAAQVELSVEVLSETGCPVEADADGLRQVMMNVLRNAVEACGAGGQVHCRVSTDGDTARVEVTDTGAGLTGESRRRAFEPFYSTKSRGTGLGLPISLRIMEENGGALRLESRKGAGTTVTLELKASDGVEE